MERREPNSKQKELMEKHGLNAGSWFVLEEDKYYLVLINRRKSRRRTIEKIKDRGVKHDRTRSNKNSN